jgi:hypothetical protein
VALLLALPASAQVNAATKKYTTTADFALGTALNVDTSGNQIDLADVVTTFPVMWIANAGEDTVSKIDTTTGKETGRYKTWFTGTAGYPAHLGNPYAGAAPSRTAVDTDGNVYVGNRHFDGRAPVLLKILASGFIDRNGNGVEDTSTDANNNGVIDPGEIKPLVDSNANQIIDPSEIQDERVAWATRLPTTENNALGRSVSIDTAGNVWFGCHNTQRYYKIRGTDGVTLSGPHTTVVGGLGHTPYGSVIDGNNILWGASLSNNLLKMDTTQPDNAALKARFVHAGQNYGIALGLQGGVQHIYLGLISGNRYVDFNTASNTFSFPNCGLNNFAGIGIATDGNGDVFIGHNNGLRKCSSAGVQIWDAPLQPGTFDGWGVVIDSDQNAWLIHRMSGTGPPGKIAKYNGATGAAMGVFNVGSNPYTYSDATGIGIFQAQRQGNWRVTQTTGLATDAWNVVWNTEPQGSVPAGTTLVVEARTAATQAGLGAAAFAPVPNGGPGCVIGNFIEVRATLTSNVPETPVLSDASIIGKCDVNGDTVVDITDINAINAARNTPSSGACDRRDADGNGTINVNDARQCAVRCTNPNCAANGGGVQ